MEEFVKALLLLALPVFQTTSLGHVIPASEGAKHVGERATVRGTIAGKHTATSSRGTPTVINLDRAYPNPLFPVLIWGSDRQQVGAVPDTGLATLVRGSSRRITIMRFRPANIRLINRRSYLPRLLLALSS